MYAALKPGKYAAIVLGDGIFQGNVYATASRISSLSATKGFQKIAIVNRDLPKSKRSVQINVRRANNEQILIIQKPDARQHYSLVPVNYTLKDFERILSDKEKKALNIPNDNELISGDLINNLKKLTFFKGYSIDDTFSDFTLQSYFDGSFLNNTGRKKNSKYITHGIHEYKGKFYPQLVRPLINISKIKEGSILWDPYCGSGTILLEATLCGLNSYGCDINPIAVDIAMAKTSILFEEQYTVNHELSEFIDSFDNYDETFNYNASFNEKNINEITRWFPQPVINKLGFLLFELKKITNTTIATFVKVLISSIIREISQQEPTDLRIRYRKNRIQDADVLGLLKKTIIEQMNKIMDYSKISNNNPNHLTKPHITKGSSCSNDITFFIAPNSVDIIITSPPYATALPYIDINRLSLLILHDMGSSDRNEVESSMTGTREISKKERQLIEQKINNNDYQDIHSNLAIKIISEILDENSKGKVGFRKQNTAALLYMYFNDLNKSMSNMNNALKKNGQAFIIVGDTKTNTAIDTKYIKTTQIIREMAHNLGWQFVEELPISVTKDNHNNIAHAITENTILWFKKE